MDPVAGVDPDVGSDSVVLLDPDAESADDLGKAPGADKDKAVPDVALDKVAVLDVPVASEAVDNSADTDKDILLAMGTGNKRVVLETAKV